MSNSGINEPSASEYGLIPQRERANPSEEELERLHEEYGRIRTYFKLRPNAYVNLQRWLLQARIPATYDQYLARTVRLALVAALIGGVTGLIMTWVLLGTGTLAELRTGIRSPAAIFIGNNRLLFATLVLVPAFGALFAITTWFGRYYYPSTVVSTRRQNIDATLPHAIVYMYALKYGGMSLIEVIRSLAEAEDHYGEVSREFDLILADTELFGSDIYTALRNARNITPSDNFEQFLDDMLSVLESGGDLETFFGEESETYLREAEDEQASFLETLALLAEVYVVGFIAAPLFIIVTLVVISFIGGTTLGAISTLVYLVLPLAVIAFLFLLDILNQPYEQAGTVSRGDAGPAGGASVPEEDGERFDAYAKNKRRLELRALVQNPMASFRRRPVLSLVVSVPVAVLLTGLLVATGVVTPSTEAMQTAPVATTAGLLVAPLLVVAIPLSTFHEYRRYRDNEIARRFPDTLNILSSANRMGIPLTEALDLVTRWSTGPLAEELRTVRNDIEWNNDTTAALLAFGNRLKVPQLSRTMKLLADGLRSSGDLSRVLSIAAEDTRNRDRIDRARRRELSTYIAVVIVGFLVYLFVIVVLDASFLRPLEGLGGGGTGATEGPVSLVNVPTEVYRLIFLHSALIMGVGAGLIAGKLADNDTLSGLKYAIALAALTITVFALI